MPTPTKGARFGGSPSHQRLILANLAQALFENGRITTTEAKARRLRPYAEHLISKAKIDTVANRRQVVKVIRDQDVLHTLFTEIGPNMATRPGGYTRITKIGPRKGDNAPMAVIEIVESKDFPAQNQTPKKPAQKAAPTVEEPKAEETTDRPQAEVEETTASPHGDPLEDAAEAVDTPEPDTAEADAGSTDEGPAEDSVDEADVEQAADDVAEAVDNEADAGTDADEK